MVRSVDTQDPRVLEQYVIEFRKDVDSRVKDLSEQIDIVIIGVTFLTGLITGILLS
ncbi:MAG TPA: hypothetical protein VE862_09715 [Candidatus Acidoferrum sp.]|nr:hypothetical protein [Candidatus Acidoferrum sp.]